jgi:Flp pilus assembly protein TadG
MRWNSSTRGWDEGATAVEAAVTISLSLALVLGIIEFGIALWQSHTMALAVEEAGRHIMVSINTLAPCNTASCAETQMINALSAYGGLVTSANNGICASASTPPTLTAGSLGNVCVFATDPTGASPQTMTLTAIYAYSSIIVPTKLLAGTLAGPFTSTSQATFPLE